MSTWASKVKSFQRRATQKVLQQIGIAEKTNDDTHSQVYQNFLALGNFITHFKQSIQNANTTTEKMTKLQNDVASEIETYVHAELSGDTDLPPGELYEFFTSQDDTSSMHAVMLQEVAEKFFFAFNDISSSLVVNMMQSLDYMVLKPIQRDEEQTVHTKELLEERKSLNLDYDSYRRVGPGSNPGDTERHEAKVRAAKEKFETSSKKVNEHLTIRNYNRCKIIVHSILSLIQQYNKFFVASSALLQEATGILNPLLEVYQLDEHQLMDLTKLEPRPKHPDGASIPTKPTPKPNPPSPKQKPQPKPEVKVSTPRDVSPPRSPREVPLNNGPSPTASNGTAPPKPKESTLIDEFVDTPIPPAKPQVNNASAANVSPSTVPPNPTAGHTSPTPPTPQPPSVSPVTTSNIFDDWERVGVTSTNNNNNNNNAPFVDVTFEDIPPVNLGNPLAPNANTSPTKATNNNASPSAQPASSIPAAAPPSASGGSFFDELVYGLSKDPKTQTPLKPQPMPQPMKPQATPFNPPPSSTFKPPASGFGSVPGGFVPPHAKPPPGFGGYGPTAYPSQTGYPPQAGPYPGGYYNPNHTRPGYGFPGAPPAYPSPPPQNGSADPYANPPNAGANFVQEIEKDGLDPSVSLKIKQWAEKGGKTNNLRALLATLHEVVWPDCGWEQKGLGELVTKAQVKKAYLQATKIIHPDKVANGTEEQKITAKRIFECLQESYEFFKKEPQ